MAAIAWGPEEMFSVKDSAGTAEGPFYQKIQDAANMGPPYTIVGPGENDIYQQQLPPEVVRRASWNNIQTWLDFDPAADISGQLIYIRLTEAQYENDDVPNYMPNWDKVDEDGNSIGARKWSEWRSNNHFHWKSQSTSVYAVPSTSWGLHINCRVLEPLDVAYTLFTQKQWDNAVDGLPPEDVIFWPQPEPTP